MKSDTKIKLNIKYNLVEIDDQCQKLERKREKSSLC
jgi:hypothetical protein